MKSQLLCKVLNTVLVEMGDIWPMYFLTVEWVLFYEKQIARMKPRACAEPSL